eukprot:CAMPEP_0196657686 /NCGR_PEP_ID=MMETSP1086-20130531/24946_1 /TAXON_ID=77921 /ORGANISM="Cyanoptyche  gloeocystis , Strain SAG4.97" /LENGTH=86 /DNA_ID=CAMNT_0041990915 /DNA_START=53 /DNA_END=313 /DNA_ORIENTATION=+
MSSKVDDEFMSATLPYSSPISVGAYPMLAVLLLGLGLFFLATFFVYEITTSKFTRSLKQEVRVAVLASFLTGFGAVFTLLSNGIYL